jgi:ubiquinone/menaquinone biosynthesis C-methylase UbiE
MLASGSYSLYHNTLLNLYVAYLFSFLGGLFYSILLAGIVYNNFTSKSVEEATFKYYSKKQLHRHASHPVIKAFAEPKIEYLIPLIPNFDKLSILDVGGGCGYWSTYMVNYCPNVSVIDISAEQIHMNPLPDSQKFVGSAYDLSRFEEKKFDMVFGSNLLHHLDRPVDAIKEYRKAASEWVVIMEPVTTNPVMWVGCQFPAHEYGVKKYTEKFVRDIIDQAGGLEVVHHTFIGGMLLPNRTPEWLLPFSCYKSRSRFSYFQIFICKVVDMPQSNSKSPVR